MHLSRSEQVPRRARCARRVAVGSGERSELRSSLKAPREELSRSESRKRPSANNKIYLTISLRLCVKKTINQKGKIMFLNIDWKGLLKAILKAALPFFIGGAIGVTASGCSSLQTPRAKTQTSAIYAFGLPAIVVTHDATQNADYSGGDTNETLQSGK